MSMSVNTNVAALNAYRNLAGTQNSLSGSLEKLSSGFRINRAADDAAGLAISEGMRSQIGGMKQAVRNAQDGISLVQTAEGALQETHAILQRMRDLAVQGANDTNNTKARENIKTELDQLREELGRIADATEFNGTKLLDGSAKGANALNFQVGANGDNASRITVDLEDANVKGVAKSFGDTINTTVSIFNVESSTGIQGNFTIDAGTDIDSNPTAKVTVALGSTAIKTSEDLVAKLNADEKFAALYTASVARDGKVQIAGKAGSTIGAVAVASGTLENQNDTITKTFGVEDHDQAQWTVSVLDEKISAISTARANLGAYQNRFDHTIKNLNVSVENLSASESRIRDTDMASEMMNFTKSQILSQAGTSMLAQANQASQSILSLLR